MLMSVDDQILVYTDHMNLEYFNTKKTLNRRQHCWAEFLQPFNFKVINREGRLKEKADALSRHRDYRPEEGSNSEPFTFFALDSVFMRRPSSCDHTCCRLAKVAGCRQPLMRLL